MPEYLAPGVYVEEVSYRPKSIEGVSTSVAGFIGPTRYGPTGGQPELLTSFADFSAIYGGLDPLTFSGGIGLMPNYLAHAVRAFFDNGGSRLYVTRVYEADNLADPLSGHASSQVGSPVALTLRARFPGQTGQMRVIFSLRASPNLLVAAAGQTTVAGQVSGILEHDVVYIKHNPGAGSAGAVTEGLYDVSLQNNALVYDSLTGATHGLADLNPVLVSVYRVTVSVSVLRLGQFEVEETWTNLSPDPGSRNALTVLFADQPGSRQRYLTIPFAIEPATQGMTGAQIVHALFGDHLLQTFSLSLDPPSFLQQQSPPVRIAPTDLQATYYLSNGSDGHLPAAEYYEGEDTGQDKTGLKTFEDVDEISIVAAPGYSANYGANPQRANQIVQDLITHCQIRMRYRVAILDSPDNQVLSEVQAFRGQFDSTHAALYYPWVTIVDPLDPDGRLELELPPSGFMAGIYARTDDQFGVFKAPANEVVLGAIGFESLINTAQQDILNPLGINCLRFFLGTGYRVWGARTISSDPDWKYISVRRYFAYLEHSIDRGTKWAVFENNSDVLWAGVTRTITDFLFNEWRNGALLGARPEDAFFVRCDRTTMTQNDLDNGRLVCLIGVAVVKPAEFVIFRIGQWTASAKAA